MLQRKYILDLLKEIEKLGCKPISTPMDSKVKLNIENIEPLKDVSRFQRLVEKLIYLIITKSNILFPINQISQFVHLPRTQHLKAINCICENLVIWKNKKQYVMARSSTMVEYRVMASMISELIWIKQLLVDLKIKIQEPIKMYCDNQAARHIISNSVFHERTNHTEADYYFICEKLQLK
jgi:hypothetical protein